MGLLLHASSRRRLAALATLVLASAFGLALVAVRVLRTGQPDYLNLVWDLVLAWVPFLLALLVYDRSRRGTRGVGLVLTGVLWLAFLPNAPYLVTELGFLRNESSVPLWFDGTMLGTFAWTGLLLGFVSVYLVQGAVRRTAGPIAGWLVALGALSLSGIGIYLGRVLRWNSWDLLLQPGSVLRDVLERLDSPRMVGTSVLIATFLTVAYAMLYTFLQAALDERARD